MTAIKPQALFLCINQIVGGGYHDLFIKDGRGGLIEHLKFNPDEIPQAFERVCALMAQHPIRQLEVKDPGKRVLKQETAKLTLKQLRLMNMGVTT